MDQILLLCLVGACVATPLGFLLLTGAMYLLGIGKFAIPGIARSEMDSEKEWTTAPDFAKKAAEVFAAAISLGGALFGLIGFMLPWVSVNFGAGASGFDIGGLNGTLSGIALAFQSFLVGIGMITSDFDGALGLGLVLIFLSLFVSLIPLALLVSTGFGLGLVSIPLGILKSDRMALFGRGLLIASLLSLCLSCTFFAGIQATVGGVQFGGSENFLGSSFAFGAEVGRGFWISVGGLVLAVVGAVVANNVASRFGNWVGRLTDLKREEEKEEK